MTQALRQGGEPFSRPAPMYREGDEGEEPVEPFVPLTRAEAQALRARLPMLSPWRVVAVQAVAGVLCVAVAWLAAGGTLAASALYGAAAVLLPQAVLARGVSRAAGNPAVAAFGFLIWEVAKIGLAVAMLAAASRVLSHPNWPALLVTMVVCMKASWLALLWQRATASRTTNKATRG